MDIKELIQSKYGMSNCDVTSINYGKHDSGKEYIETQFKYSGEEPLVCPECGHKLYKHDLRDITIMDTPEGGKASRWVIQYPRRRCKNCGFLWHPVFDNIDVARRITSRAFLNIAQKSLENTFESVAEDYLLTATSVKNIFIDFIKIKEKQLRFVTPQFMGIDEIKIKKIGEVTVITDLEHHTVYDMILGKTQEILTDYFSKLPDKDKVLWICSDMYRPFEKSVAGQCENARWVIDHFHVVSYANKAMDYVRIKIQRNLSKTARIKTKKGMAYSLRTRTKDLTPDDAVKLRELRDLPETDKRHPMIVAYDLKEEFFNIYDNHQESKELAIQAYQDWLKKIPPVPTNGSDDLYKAFRQLGEMVIHFYDQIFQYWDCPIAISNGFTECSNRLIRERNLRGRGYSFEVLRARSLYREKNLELILKSGMATGPSFESNRLLNTDLSDADIEYEELTDAEIEEMEYEEEESIVSEFEKANENSPA